VESTQHISARRWRKAELELDELRNADILILNEVDFGLKRTGYANVAAERAKSAGMNYTFGVEFVEVDRLYTGDERIQMKTPELTQALANAFRVDPTVGTGCTAMLFFHVFLSFPQRSSGYQSATTGMAGRSKPSRT
jgi:hypothetical protein